MYSDNLTLTLEEGLSKLKSPSRPPITPLEKLLMRLEARFSKLVAYIFYKIGRDHWHKNTKISIFLTIALGPVVALELYALLTSLKYGEILAKPHKKAS